MQNAKTRSLEVCVIITHTCNVSTQYLDVYTVAGIVYVNKQATKDSEFWFSVGHIQERERERERERVID